MQEFLPWWSCSSVTLIYDRNKPKRVRHFVVHHLVVATNYWTHFVTLRLCPIHLIDNSPIHHLQFCHRYHPSLITLSLSQISLEASLYASLSIVQTNGFALRLTSRIRRTFSRIFRVFSLLLVFNCSCLSVR